MYYLHISLWHFKKPGFLYTSLQIKERIASGDSRIHEETLYLGGYEREIHSTRTSGNSPPVTTRTVHRHSIGGLAVYTRTVLPGVAGQQVSKRSPKRRAWMFARAVS